MVYIFSVGQEIRSVVVEFLAPYLARFHCWNYRAILPDLHRIASRLYTRPAAQGHVWGPFTDQPGTNLRVCTQELPGIVTGRELLLTHADWLDHSGKLQYISKYHQTTEWKSCRRSSFQKHRKHKPSNHPFFLQCRPLVILHCWWRLLAWMAGVCRFPNGQLCIERWQLKGPDGLIYTARTLSR